MLTRTVGGHPLHDLGHGERISCSPGLLPGFPKYLHMKFFLNTIHHRYCTIYRVTTQQARTHGVCTMVLRCASCTETMTCATNTAEKTSTDSCCSEKPTGLSLCSEMGVGTSSTLISLSGKMKLIELNINHI